MTGKNTKFSRNKKAVVECSKQLKESNTTMKNKEIMLKAINEFCTRGYRALETASEKKSVLDQLQKIDNLFVNANFFYQEKALEEVANEYEVIQLVTADKNELSFILESKIVAGYYQGHYKGAAYGERDYDFYVCETNADGDDGIYIEVNKENTNWMNALSKIGLLSDVRTIPDYLLNLVFNYAKEQNELASEQRTLSYEGEIPGIVVENRHKTVARLKIGESVLYVGKAFSTSSNYDISKVFAKMTMEELKDKRKELDQQIISILKSAFVKIKQETNITYEFSGNLHCVSYVGYDNDGEKAYFVDWGVEFDATRKNGPKAHFEIYAERTNDGMQPKRYETVYCSSDFYRKDEPYRILCAEFDQTPGINQLMTDLYRVNTLIDDKKFFASLVEKNPEITNAFERVIGSKNAVGYLEQKNGMIIPLVNNIVVDQYIG